MYTVSLISTRAKDCSLVNLKISGQTPSRLTWLAASNGLMLSAASLRLVKLALELAKIFNGFHLQ